ncbi:VanZ family protein [Oceanobacillus picturae]|uniref:VanZ family protein n=1 Tax=Oceanobacillus picturae TaxID=171693 RepID=UPI003629226E
MKIIKVIFKVSFVIYLIALTMLLFLRNRGYMWADLSLLEYIKSSSNVVPFKTINTYFQAIFDGSMNLDIPLKNLGGNIFMFLPMGIYMPFYITKLTRVSTFTAFMVVLLFIIETLQLLTRTGSFDIDDFILNMLGALLGYGIWKTLHLQKFVRQ